MIVGPLWVKHEEMHTIATACATACATAIQAMVLKLVELEGFENFASGHPVKPW